MYTNTLQQSTVPLMCFVIMALCPLLDVKSESDFEWCPESWTSYVPANKCFSLKTSKTTVETAKANCKTDNYSQLVEVHTRTEADFLCQMHKHISADYVFHGIRDQHNRRPYTYFSNGATVDTSVINWASDEPNNNGEKCMCVDKKCKFHDISCGLKYPYICEIIDVDLCKIYNGGCDHECHTTGLHKRECTCGDSSFVLVNQTECVKLCDYMNGNCSQECTPNQNATTGVECSCYDGYTMNGAVCEKEDEDPPVGMTTILIIILIALCVAAIAGWLVYSRRKTPTKEPEEMNKDDETPVQDTEEVEEHEGEEEAEEPDETEDQQSSRQTVID